MASSAGGRLTDRQTERQTDAACVQTATRAAPPPKAAAQAASLSLRMWRRRRGGGGQTDGFWTSNKTARASRSAAAVLSLANL